MQQGITNTNIPNIIKVALIQMSMFTDENVNLKKAIAKIKEAKLKGADIVCLPELFNSRYFPQSESDENFKLAQKIPGHVTNEIAKASKENKVVVIAGSIFEKDKEGFYNTSVVFNNGSMLGKYRKIHIPYDPYFYEKKYFKHGNEYPVFDTGFVKIGVMICYDQWFPEAARENTLRGAQIIFYPTAIGWFEELKKLEPFSQKRWIRDQCSHASLNGIYVIAVNRVGKEENLEFWGSSFIADPFGNIVVKASNREEEVVVASLDLGLIEKSRTWGFLENRMPKTYSTLAKHE